MITMSRKTAIDQAAVSYHAVGREFVPINGNEFLSYNFNYTALPVQIQTLNSSALQGKESSSHGILANL